MNQLFNDEEIKLFGSDLASVFGFMFTSKLKDVLGDDFFKLVVAVQNKEPTKAKVLLKTKNVNVNEIVNDVFELISNDFSQKLSKSLEAESDEVKKKGSKTLCLARKQIPSITSRIPNINPKIQLPLEILKT